MLVFLTLVSLGTGSYFAEAHSPSLSNVKTKAGPVPSERCFVWKQLPNSRCCISFDSFRRLMRPSRMSQHAARFFLIQQSPSQQADVCHRLDSDQPLEQRQQRDEHGRKSFFMLQCWHLCVCSILTEKGKRKTKEGEDETNEKKKLKREENKPLTVDPSGVSFCLGLMLQSKTVLNGLEINSKLVEFEPTCYSEWPGGPCVATDSPLQSVLSCWSGTRRVIEIFSPPWPSMGRRHDQKL